MNKVIVSNKILADAYNNAFLNLEKMNYQLAGKLLDFAERNNYPVERDMVDYAKVIIFSNSDRVDDAVNLSEKMISRGLQTKELQMIVNDVHAQLLKQKEYSDRRKKKVERVSLEEVKSFLNIIRPSDSKLSEFINFFSIDTAEENQFISYYQKNQLLETESSFIEQLKILIAKQQFIEDTYRTALFSLEDAKIPLYTILNKTLLNSYSGSEFMMFLYMHKTGLIKELLVDPHLDARVRSFLAYQVDDLYTNKLIGRVKVKMLIGTQVYEESIKDLNDNFNNAVEEYGDCLEEFLERVELGEEYVNQILSQFQRMISYTYPVVNPINIPVEKFIASFLYVISNNNYNSQFNAIIEDVYNLNQEELIQDMQMIEVLILI